MDRWRRPRRRPKAHRLTWDPRDYSPGAFFYWSLDGHALYRKAAARCLTFLFFFFLFRFFIFSGKDSFFQGDIRQNLADARHSAPSILGQNSTFRHCRWSPTATFVHQRDTQKRR